ncbi:MAG: GNAT family N-acetyltransferase [Candidatus Aenigmarchaeota archaeon]|nr:GNAT family N-acetyltransferase [Candidatus Aenigmarchaeota archaeon]
MIKVRDGRPGDADKICGYKLESVRLNFPECEFSDKMFRAHLLRQLRTDPENVKVIEADGKVAGYIWLKIVESTVGTFGRIEHVFVDRGFRNHGIGKRLMLAAEDYFRGRGIKKVKLTVTADNKAAVSLYRHMGFETRRYVMEKDL